MPQIPMEIPMESLCCRYEGRLNRMQILFAPRELIRSAKNINHPADSECTVKHIHSLEGQRAEGGCEKGKSKARKAIPQSCARVEIVFLPYIGSSSICIVLFSFAQTCPSYDYTRRHSRADSPRIAI